MKPITTGRLWKRSASIARRFATVIDQSIATLPLTLPITWESPFWAILMCIEHERIHLETSSVLHSSDRYQPRSHPIRFFRDFHKHGQPPKNEFVAVSGGDVSLGVRIRSTPCMAGIMSMEAICPMLNPLRHRKYLVSNQEYLEFVEAGGYNKPEYWT